MARGVAVSAEVKAAAMAALLDGQAVSQVAKTYKISLSTVKSWRYREVAPALPRAAEMTIATPRLGDLVLANLEAMLAAVQEIVIRVSKDEGWIKRQTASELAVFVGVLSDKAFRVIEALPKPESEPDADVS